MTALAVLIPGLIIGAIAWGAVGILRQRGRETFTLATALAFYARILTIAGVLAMLSGLAVLVKLGLSLLNAEYAYFLPPASPVAIPQGGYYGPTIAQQQGQDLILAVMLIGIGLALSGGHWTLSRYAARLPGGSPAWISGGGLVAITLLTGLAGFVTLVIGGYQALSYFVVGNTQGMTFADPVGAAAIFVPAWAVAMAWLLGRTRRAAVPALPRGAPAAG